MSKSKQIETLYELINNQNNVYVWTVGIFITIIVAILGFFAYFQWRLNTSQENKMVNRLKASLENEYHFERDAKLIENMCDIILTNFVERYVGVRAFLNPEKQDYLGNDLMHLLSMTKIIYKDSNIEYQLPNLITVFFNMLVRVEVDQHLEDKFIQQIANNINETLKNKWPKEYMEHVNYSAIENSIRKLNQNMGINNPVS